LTYAVTRAITVRIRRRKASGAAEESGAIKDVHIGGVHVHHQVWGILLVLFVGLLTFRFSPGGRDRVRQTARDPHRGRATAGPGRRPPWQEHRHRRGGPPTGRDVYYALRDGHVRALTGRCVA
jgi:hypothetical protein